MALAEMVEVYANGIEDVTPRVDDKGETYLEITLSDVDITQLITDIGLENLLEDMDREEVMKYYEELDKSEEDD